MNQVQPAVASPTANVPGAKPDRPFPGCRPSSVGSCDRKISTATPFMKPASTGCGTNCARRPSPSRAMTICSRPIATTIEPAAAITSVRPEAPAACTAGSRTNGANAPAKISAVAELGPATGIALWPKNASIRPPMVTDTKAAARPSGAAASPSGA